MSKSAKLGKLDRFTSHPSFLDYLDLTIVELKAKIECESSTRSDTLATTGMTGLALHCYEKASRFFHHVEGTSSLGKDFEEELEDGVVYYIFALTYYRMLKAKAIVSLVELEENCIGILIEREKEREDEKEKEEEKEEEEENGSKKS